METEVKPRLAYGIIEAAHALGMSERQIYKMMSSGQLRRVKVGTRTLIPVESLHALLEGGA